MLAYEDTNAQEIDLTIHTVQMNKLQKMRRCGEQKMRWGDEERRAVPRKNSLVSIQGSSSCHCNQNALPKSIGSSKYKVNMILPRPRR